MLSKALLAVVALAAAAPAHAETNERTGPTELAWQWGEPHRFYVETEVIMPRPMWFVAEFNKEQRAVAFQVRAVLSCGRGRVERKRVREVMCAVEDIAIQAGGMPKKEGLLQPILEELDERLTDAEVQLQVRADGRILNLDLEGLDRRNRRVGAMNENLRLVMSRTVAGFDLQLPSGAPEVGEVWPQYQNWLMQAPSTLGSTGTSEILHKIREIRPDGTVQIESGGRGVIVPSETDDKYETRVVGFGVFDPADGALLERTWSAVGAPTASSTIAEGGAGLKYVQRGRMKRLDEGEEVAVGETLEVTAPGATPTTLQVWPPLGATPNPTPR